MQVSGLSHNVLNRAHALHSFCLVDHLHNTAADIALSMNNEGCYRVIRDAGIRSGESTVIQFRGPSQSCLLRVVAGFDHM